MRGASHGGAYGVRETPAERVQARELAQALRGLVDGIRRERVEELAAFGDDVLGDEDTGAGVGVGARVVASERAYADGLGEVRVEARFGLADVRIGPAFVAEVSLDAQVRRDAVGDASGALDGEASIGRDAGVDRSGDHVRDFDAGMALAQGPSEPCGIQGLFERLGHCDRVGHRCSSWADRRGRGPAYGRERPTKGFVEVDAAWAGELRSARRVADVLAGSSGHGAHDDLRAGAGGGGRQLAPVVGGHRGVAAPVDDRGGGARRVQQRLQLPRHVV